MSSGEGLTALELAELVVNLSQDLARPSGPGEVKRITAELKLAYAALAKFPGRVAL